jgi:hypothetical protein
VEVLKECARQCVLLLLVAWIGRVLNKGWSLELCIVIKQGAGARHQALRTTAGSRVKGVRQALLFVLWKKMVALLMMATGYLRPAWGVVR